MSADVMSRFLCWRHPWWSAFGCVGWVMLMCLSAGLMAHVAPGVAWIFWAQAALLSGLLVGFELWAQRCGQIYRRLVLEGAALDRQIDELYHSLRPTNPRQCDLASDGQPCWGAVSEVTYVDHPDHSDIPMHVLLACAGHMGVVEGLPYLPPPPTTPS